MHNIPKNMQVIVGIDEAGRGPIAGPVAVAAVKIKQKKNLLRIAKQLKSNKKKYPFRDSKQLSEKQRVKIFNQLKKLKKNKKIDFTCTLVSAYIIDRDGISKAICIGIARVLRRLGLNQKKTAIVLDGLLRAPQKYTHQQTLTKGDQRELSIALASIVAKVTRDQYMVRRAAEYPEYGFEQHKGYGTKGHYWLIKKNGVVNIHRRSFL